MNNNINHIKLLLFIAASLALIYSNFTNIKLAAIKRPLITKNGFSLRGCYKQRQHPR
jgi:hypothetical protein